MNRTTSLLHFFSQFNVIKKVPENDDGIQDICSVTTKIGYNYLWILFAVGFPANVLTIITTLTMQAMSPATFFVALLAAFDGAALAAKLIYNQVLFYQIPMNEFSCKIEFIILYLPTVANWMLVLICAERFVSVCYPLKKISLITKRRSYIAAAVVAVFILILYGAISIPLRKSIKIACYTKQGSEYFWIHYWYWINAAFFLFVPFLLIFIFTTGIIRGLHMSRRDRRSLMVKGSGKEGGTETSARNNERLMAETERIERTITIMMILAGVLFITLSLPACVYYLMPGAGENVDCYESISMARWDIFKQIQHVLVDATHAINFFIYFFTAKRFRDQLFKLLTCKLRKKDQYHNKNQHTYSTHVSTASKVNSSAVPLKLST